MSKWQKFKVQAAEIWTSAKLILAVMLLGMAVRMIPNSTGRVMLASAVSNWIKSEPRFRKTT